MGTLKNSRLGRWWRHRKGSGCAVSPVSASSQFLSPEEMCSTEDDRRLLPASFYESPLASSPQIELEPRHVAASGCWIGSSEDGFRPSDESWRFFNRDTSGARSPGRISSVSPASPKSHQWASGVDKAFPWEPSAMMMMSRGAAECCLPSEMVLSKQPVGPCEGCECGVHNPASSKRVLGVSRTQAVTVLPKAEAAVPMTPATFELIEIDDGHDDGNGGGNGGSNDETGFDEVVVDEYGPQVLNIPPRLKEPKNRRQFVEAKNVRRKWLVGCLRGLNSQGDLSEDGWQPYAYDSPCAVDQSQPMPEYRPEYRDCIPRHSIFNPGCYQYKTIYLDTASILTS